MTTEMCAPPSFRSIAHGAQHTHFVHLMTRFDVVPSASKKAATLGHKPPPLPPRCPNENATNEHRTSKPQAQVTGYEHDYVNGAARTRKSLRTWTRYYNAELRPSCTVQPRLVHGSRIRRMARFWYARAHGTIVTRSANRARRAWCNELYARHARCERADNRSSQGSRVVVVVAGERMCVRVRGQHYYTTDCADAKNASKN